MARDGNSKDKLSQRAKTQFRIGGKFASSKSRRKASPKKSTPLTKGLVPPTSTRKPIINIIGLLVDASGSMDPHRAKAAEVVNAQLRAIHGEILKSRQPTEVEIVVFNDTTYPMPVHDPGAFHFAYPQAFHGGTTLWNSIESIINIMEEMGKKYPDAHYDKSFLLYVISDGEEMHSHSRAPYRTTTFIKELLRQKLASDQWIFGFLAPPGGARTYQQFGITAGNVTEWETTNAGFRDLDNSLRKGTSNYYTSRSLGIRSQAMNTSQANLFQVDLDKQRNVLGNFSWNELSNTFKPFKVEKEQDIKSFVEAKTGTFQEGAAYYQLTKKELVQAYKDMVVQDKDTQKVLTGASAKSAIGMPLGKDFKVEPHNLSKYKLFVQSTSNNRKLVRGTEVLVRK